MMNEHEYYKLWKTVPRESSPPELCGKIIQSSGILNQDKQRRSRSCELFYVFANLAMVLMIILMIGFNVEQADDQSQQRLTRNVICLAEKASFQLQTILIEKERTE